MVTAGGTGDSLEGGFGKGGFSVGEKQVLGGGLTLS